MKESICISKEEYERLKKSEKTDKDLLMQIAASLDDLRHGRIRRIV